jgi:hypothetical protein
MAIRGTGLKGWRSIMKSTLGYFDRLLIVFSLYPVDQSVLLVNPPGPPALQNRFKRLWLANTFEGITANIFDQIVYLPNLEGVGLLPPDILIPCPGGPKHPHLASSSAIDSRRT